jgi:hypothetical protein
MARADGVNHLRTDAAQQRKELQILDGKKGDEVEAGKITAHRLEKHDDGLANVIEEQARAEYLANHPELTEVVGEEGIGQNEESRREAGDTVLGAVGVEDPSAKKPGEEETEEKYIGLETGAEYDWEHAPQVPTGALLSFKENIEVSDLPDKDKLAADLENHVQHLEELSQIERTKVENYKRALKFATSRLIERLTDKNHPPHLSKIGLHLGSLLEARPEDDSRLGEVYLPPEGSEGSHIPLTREFAEKLRLDLYNLCGSVPSEENFAVFTIEAPDEESGKIMRSRRVSLSNIPGMVVVEERFFSHSEHNHPAWSLDLRPENSKWTELEEDENEETQQE